MNNSESEKASPNSQVLLNQLVLNYMEEKKRQKRWKAVKFIAVIFLIAVIARLFMNINAEDSIARTKAHVGLIDISGTIAEESPADSENFAKSMDDAYKSSGLKALVLRINSPGGSPVQAEYIYNTIRFYQQKYPDIKVYSVCVDACASAAYYIAVAADEIYASPASLVGSIGVLFNGFGFVDTLQKVGATRRLHTAGANKGFLDPFMPENPAQIQLLDTMLKQIHEQFIARVKEGRGDRLVVNNDLFSGLFWTGQQAKELGLIDGFASAGQLARHKLQIEDMINYTNKQNLFERIAKNIGVAFADQLPEALGMRTGFR